VDVLEDVPSLKIPFDHLLELLHRLQVRYYSISSSAKVYFTSVHVTASLVSFKTRLGRQGKGVATSWLQGLLIGAKVPIFLRASSFRLPPETKTPVIMVGPGTGLAPFRGFIQDRDFQLIVAKKSLGETVLFFGCQKRAQHFLYETELQSYVTAGSLSHLFVACSRDQAEKVYVQHHMRQNGKFVYDLLKRGAHFYLCGDGKYMARDVHEALVDILVKEGEQTKQAAEDFLKQLSSKKRFQQDVWA
jgi:NADPH-ferrihemoprotein reductase